MKALNAHYDGKVIIPDEPLDLPANQKVRISIEMSAIESPPAKASSFSEPTVGSSTVSKPQKVDLSGLRGSGLPLPLDHSPRFSSNDALWDKDK